MDSKERLAGNGSSGRRLQILVSASAAIVGISALAMAWFVAMPMDETIDPDDPVLVSQGAAVYRDYCAACHGQDLEGQPNWQKRDASGRLPAPPHDETGHTWHHPDDVLFDIVKYGISRFAPPGYESDMPAFDGVLSDTEIRAVLSYIKSTWPERLRTRQAETSRASPSG